MSSIGDTAATFCATLVDEWIRQGVRHAMVAPGSRSTPLAVALAHRDEIAVHIFHDERSASFAALGIALAQGRPAILLCTSGTAATHFHGAVVEAHQSNVPIIVCTADRPPELRDVGAPQTIDQTKLFGSAVRWSHDPGVPSDDARGSWRALAARSYAESLGARPGPVHLNLPFREPLVGNVQELPVARDGAWSQTFHAQGVDQSVIATIAAQVTDKTGIVIAGRGATRDVLSVAKALNWPVFADPRSGLRECDESVVLAFDSIVRVSQFVSTHKPDVVLWIGEPPASKVLAQWVSSLDAFKIHISSTPSVIDPQHSNNLSVSGDVGLMCERLIPLVRASSKEWLLSWQKAETAAQKAIAAWTAENFSEPTVARVLTSSLAVGDQLVVSSSMPIRDVEWFGSVTSGVTVHSNRGANGIDGVVSTAVGVALGSGSPTSLLIGDVALLHDVNGLLALNRRTVDMSIVVTNNDGGSIFSFLPQADHLDRATFELLYGTPHGVSFEHVAKTYGLSYFCATDEESLRDALAQSGTKIVEVVLDRTVNVSQHDELNSSIAAVVVATA